MENQRGSALVVVITIVYGLFVIGLGLQAIMGNDLERAVQFRNVTRARFIAQAGSRVALQQLQSLQHSFAALNQGWYNNEALYKEVPFEKGSFTVFHPGAEGTTLYGMADEESKVHLNKAPLSMLTALPGMNYERAAAIVQYRDKKLFDLPTELLTLFADQPALFPGGEESFTLQPLITVWGSGKINLNTAPKAVLMTLPGLNAESAERLLQHRRGLDGQEGTADDQPFESVEALQALHLISVEHWPTFQQLATVHSTAFSFLAQGRTGQRLGDAVGTIMAVIERRGQEIAVQYWKTW
jgi:type II secretory pathway component PulK